MALHNNKNTVIHASGDANFSAYTYQQVYASSAATININSTSVNLAAGTILDIVVKSIGSDVNVYVLGSPRNTATGGGGNLGSINS